MVRHNPVRRRRRHSNEFKMRAVKLASARNVQVQDVAAALGIHPYMLSRWKAEARQGRLKSSPAKLPTNVHQQVRINKLEREIESLKAEVRVLRKMRRYAHK